MDDRVGYLETPLPLPAESVQTVGRSLTRLLARTLTHGALLARFARWSSAIIKLIFPFPSPIFVK